MASSEFRPSILLVVPRYLSYGMANHYVMPMGILYVSAYLKREGAADVFTVNLNHVEGDEREALARALERSGAAILGIGGISGEYQDIQRIATYARELSPELKIIVGGGIVSGDPLTTMKAIAEADFGVVGEGELTMTELVHALGRGVTDFSHIHGLVFRRGSELVQTAAREEIKDLDSLPFPDYEGFDYGEYLRCNPDLSDEGRKYSQVSVIGGRSCKYNCTFCFHPSGTKYRQRSLDSIFAEIDWLVEHYDISYIALREELFATDNRRVAEFVRRVEKYDFDWSIQLRIDSVNPELVELLRNTRCRYLFVGVESADDAVLKSMHKGITRADIERALTMLHDAGLNSRSGVIFGDSAETWESAMSTLQWFRDNFQQFRMFVDMIIAFPGSIIYKRACRAGIIPDPVQFLRDGCPIVNLSQMTDEQFDRLVHLIEKTNYRKYNVKHYDRRP